MQYLIDIHESLDKSFQESVGRGDLTSFAFITKADATIQSYGGVGTKGLLLYRWGSTQFSNQSRSYTGNQVVDLHFWYTAPAVPKGETHIKTDNYVSMQNVLSLLLKNITCIRADSMNYAEEGEFVKFSVSIDYHFSQDFKLGAPTTPVNNLDIGSMIVKEL